MLRFSSKLFLRFLKIARWRQRMGEAKLGARPSRRGRLSVATATGDEAEGVACRSRLFLDPDQARQIIAA